MKKEKIALFIKLKYFKRSEGDSIGNLQDSYVLPIKKKVIEQVQAIIIRER